MAAFALIGVQGLARRTTLQGHRHAKSSALYRPPIALSTFARPTQAGGVLEAGKMLVTAVALAAVGTGVFHIGGRYVKKT